MTSWMLVLKEFSDIRIELKLSSYLLITKDVVRLLYVLWLAIVKNYAYIIC